jgi:protein TonB
MRALSITGQYLGLKKTYQRNMFLGFGISAGTHLLIIGAILLTMALGSQSEIMAPQIVIRSTQDIIMPPSLSHQEKQIMVNTPEREIRPSVGMPVPVPAEEAPEEIEIATQDELADMAPVAPVEDLSDVGVNVDVESVIDDLLPKPTDFVPFEEKPVKVVDVKPEYPPLAQRAGIEGDVWVNALIDKEGRVRDVIIVKASGANAGFEEAAVEAARKTVWKPAIANGQPIAVWTTYKIKFRLR